LKTRKNWLLLLSGCDECAIARVPAGYSAVLPASAGADAEADGSVLGAADGGVATGTFSFGKR
jgi:hypothetical protein